jgi:hypothetical protein
VCYICAGLVRGSPIKVLAFAWRGKGIAALRILTLPLFKTRFFRLICGLGLAIRDNLNLAGFGLWQGGFREDSEDSVWLCARSAVKRRMHAGGYSCSFDQFKKCAHFETNLEQKKLQERESRMFPRFYPFNILHPTSLPPSRSPSSQPSSFHRWREKKTKNVYLEICYYQPPPCR